MNDEPNAIFLHQLVFQCRDCSKPIALPELSGERNLEVIDNRIFHLQCVCGWVGDILGIRARKHWVDSWP